VKEGIDMDKQLIINARRASMENYIKSTGGTLLKEGRQYRVEGRSGLMISGNKWYSHTRLKGGNTLDYLVEMEGIEFKKAVEILSMINTDIVPPVMPSGIKNISVPERNTNDKRVIAYLVKTRGISPETIIPLLRQGRVYESSVTHNCVFTGVDGNNSIRYIMQRSTSPASSLKFESQGSDKAYSFSLQGKNDIVYVFESPIDLLSYSCMYSHVLLQESHMLSLGGLADIALEAYAARIPCIRHIIFCLDQDSAGKDAYTMLSKKYVTKGFKIGCHFPQQKDWNMQLLNQIGLKNLAEHHM